jgi:phosphatidate cytidylyltransferase
MLLKRALVALTLGPLTLFLIYLGGWFYFLPFAALLIIATIEYAQLMGKLGWPTPLWLLIPVACAQWILPLSVQSYLFDDLRLNANALAVALLIGLLVALFYALWLYERRTEVNAPGAWLAMIGGIMLMGWLGSHFFRVRGLPHMAAQWTALAMLGTWIADSAAYVVGKSMGRHKLAPRLSPNKTIEGYVGGILIGTLSTVLIAALLKVPIGQALVLGLLVSAISPAGDLGISLLKRTVGVKDSGNILPGHGGALDRTDSLVWSVAMAYYLVLFWPG